MTNRELETEMELVKMSLASMNDPEKMEERLANLALEIEADDFLRAEKCVIATPLKDDGTYNGYVEMKLEDADTGKECYVVLKFKGKYVDILFELSRRIQSRGAEFKLVSDFLWEDAKDMLGLEYRLQHRLSELLTMLENGFLED